MGDLPKVERYTLADLRTLTDEADLYVNEPKRYKSQQRRSMEVIEKLNATIQGKYLHQPVSIYGIHKKIAHDKQNNLHVYLKNGALKGLSEGFIVIDFETDFDDIGADESQNQADLLANLKEFAPGRYAVSHLVRLMSMQGHTDDFLLQQTIVTRGLSPACTSEIFIDEEAEIPEDSRLLEAERIVALSSGSAAQQLRFIESCINNAPDPLQVLVDHARKFRGMKPSDQYGYRRIIDSSAGPNLFGQKYLFKDGLPLFFQQQNDGSEAPPSSMEISCEIFIAGVERGPHYEVDWRAGHGKTTEETALYLVGYLIRDGQYGASPVVIHLEYLKDLEILRCE